MTGAVKDQVLDIELLAMRLLDWLRAEYPALLERYKLTPADVEGLSPYELLELVGRKRGMLISGGEVNTERAAVTVLDEYRGGKLGRLTLEAPAGGDSMTLYEYDRSIGIGNLCGVDEAGRGPAGRGCLCGGGHSGPGKAD